MKACTLKLDLTKKQEATLADWLWVLTGVYNWAIRKIELDAKDGIYHSTYDLEALVARHSKKVGVPARAIKGTIETAHDAWARCFKGIGGKPRLKGNRNRLNSISLPERIDRPNANRISLAWLPKLKFHKMSVPEGEIKRSQLIRRASGWYLYLIIDAEREPIERERNGQVGIDPGFRNLLTLSTGEVIGHPRELEYGSVRLGQAQRGENKRLAARLQERLRNLRKDRNHKLSLRLVKENSFVAFSADVHSGIAKRFGKSVASSSHYQLRQMLAYKSRAGGTRYVEVSSKFSTKRCSNCGSLSGPSGLGSLAVRRWTCGCGAEHDRDCNAAINTLFAGLGMSHERVA